VLCAIIKYINVAQNRKAPISFVPIRYLFSFGPGEWQIDSGHARLMSQPKLGQPQAYDLWELRESFLEIERGNEAAALKFLNRTGFWKAHSNSFLIDDFWNDQQAIRFLLTGKPNKSFAKYSPKPFEFLQVALLESLHFHGIWMWDQAKIPPTLELEGVGTRGALFVSVWLDLARKARFRYCARHDCPEHKPTQGPFEPNRMDQIYCSQYCAHVESQRRKRAERKHRLHKRR
jgi:hypothetical protein